ncbi:hypothetical protein Forpi1262_v003469 [Fusarium oxysporum f. sp. raphani]|uniref:SigF-like NTF2-like domain-containing protein n=1 Tax=Fusarium oxysporum f. sp. raphani TaxID=96318 RepID=A0A8J5QHJ3_FUSOX|nr:hypothetical protein Forpi1262_v003469 [Fusarium oxysporum f. sp. raphani]
MEHPVKEIGGVIKSLTQGSPDVQESTLREYFLPMPRSRIHTAVFLLYRRDKSLWREVDSAAFDQKSGLLYVSIRQTFALWFIPLYKAPVKLVSVLQLTQLSPESSSEDEGPMDSKPRRQNPRYYIASQEDLYPVNDCIQFLCPGLGPFLWTIWQLYSTWLCVMGSLLFLPVYFLLNGTPSKTKKRIPKF